MNVLILGLYVEGPTDKRFLPLVIQRTSEQILNHHDRMNIEVREPIVVEKDLKISGLDKCIEQAAREARNYHALIIHSDADDRGYEQTLYERFKPGYERVQKATGRICKSLLPIVPVRMTEAWMLADPHALKTVLGTNLDIHSLGMSRKARLVESDKDPKETIKQIVCTAYPRQQRQWGRIEKELYMDLASIINLDRLNQVPSYMQFVSDMTATLKTLNFIH